MCPYSKIHIRCHITYKRAATPTISIVKSDSPFLFLILLYSSLLVFTLPFSSLLFPSLLSSSLLVLTLPFSSLLFPSRPYFSLLFFPLPYYLPLLFVISYNTLPLPKNVREAYSGCSVLSLRRSFVLQSFPAFPCTRRC